MNGNQASAQFAAQAPLAKAQLVATTKDLGPWNKREWTVAGRAELDKTTARVTATLPEGTRAFYFMLFDARDCVASSEHVELPTSSARVYVARSGNHARPRFVVGTFRDRFRAGNGDRKRRRKLISSSPPLAGGRNRLKTLLATL